MGGWFSRAPGRSFEAHAPPPRHSLQLVMGKLVPWGRAGVESAYSISRSRNSVLCEMWQYCP